ncbi:MAG TPA: hypothetical protein VF584_24190 [Longimicrobium sp.]|jgi:hypothetical protein
MRRADREEPRAYYAARWGGEPTGSSLPRFEDVIEGEEDFQDAYY